MLKKLMATADDRNLLTLRFVLGIVIFPHGFQKVFGDQGLSGTIGFFSSLGIPVVFGYLAVAAEFLGSLGLILGLLTRVAAFGIACNMVVAVYMVHWGNGFFMNWGGTQKGEGYEYHVLAVGIALVLMFAGGGRLSLDRALSNRSKA
jgi:putative oxidoreductase